MSYWNTAMRIAAEDIDKIFNQFYRFQSSSNPEIKGTRWGTSIVKKSCSLLRIDIAITTQENKRTTIILRLFQAHFK